MFRDLGFRVLGLVCVVFRDLGFRDLGRWDLEVRVQRKGLGFRVQRFRGLGG